VPSLVVPRLVEQVDVTDHELVFAMDLPEEQWGLDVVRFSADGEELRVDASNFDGFHVDTVASYGEADRQRLLADAGIIRNRLKVDAVIDNARRIQQLRESHGSFAGWMDAHHPLPKEEWVKLFKRTFRFTGGEIVGEFLMSTGWLPGAHQPECPVYPRIVAANPPWLRAA